MKLTIGSSIQPEQYIDYSSSGDNANGVADGARKQNS